MTDTGYTRSQERPSSKVNGGGAEDAFKPSPPITPFDMFDAGDWEGVPVEPRRWLVLNRIPLAEPGITSGDGGTGKTKLMLQLSVAVAASLPDWVGGVVETHGPVIVYSAEEKLKEMHRRCADILAHRGLSFDSLKGRLKFICDPDEVILGKAERDGIVKPTMSLLRLEKTVALIRPALIVTENAADVYAGDENNRSTVARFVRKLLGGLTEPSGATVALIQHPSVSGLNDGTGRSGTTGWNNAGRWRLNLTKPRSEEDRDAGIRQLEVMKSNYGPEGEKIRVRWERGVFVPQGMGSPVERSAAETPVDDAFMRCLDAANAQNRSASPNKGSTYAPAVFEGMAESAGFNRKALADALERLFSAGRIEGKLVGPPSKQRTQIVRAGGSDAAK